MLEYKVLTKRGGKVGREALETTLNGYAADGWRLAGSFSAANAASLWTPSRAETVVILERSAGEFR